MKKTIWGRLTEFFTGAGSTISRSIRVVSSRFNRLWTQPTQDWGRPDYEFWRRAYYGRAVGLELSGLFIRPLVNKIAAWTFGRAPNWKCENEASAEALEAWWNQNHPAILRAWRASLRQGDKFLVVNPDLTITLIPPDLVDPIVDENDFAVIIGWRVTQVLQHPQRTAEKMTVIDEYFIDRRIHRVEVNALPTQEIVYPNLLGRLQIVHIANQPDDGETFGHAEGEALVELLQRYGETLEAAIKGNIRQGRPTPVLSFEERADLDKFWDTYGTTETATLADGTTEPETVLNVDLDQLLTISGGTFSYESPGSFSADTEKLLGLMFYLILEHTELPEFVFGNAIASSMASANTQMPIFIRFIEMRRGEMVAWLTEIAEIVLAYLSIITPGVTLETPTLQFEKLEQDDGTLTLETIKWALMEGLLDKRTALMLAPVEIENIDDVLATAEKEMAERQADMEALAAAAPNASNTPPVNEIDATDFESLFRELRDELLEVDA